MTQTTKDLLDFWEDQMKLSHMSSNYFFRKSPSHYHMMLLVMNAFKYKENLTVEELKTRLFKTSRPKSALMINEACEKGFFFLEKTQDDQRKKCIKPTVNFVKEFDKGSIVIGSVAKVNAKEATISLSEGIDAILKVTELSQEKVDDATKILKEGDEVEINLTFFDHDKKRLHFKMEMIEKSSKKLSATLEMLSLYIDLNKRRVAEFEDEKVKLMDNFINLNKSNFKNDDLVIIGKLKK